MLNYEQFKTLSLSLEKPFACVDLDALDRNIDKIKSKVEKTGKTLRIASKSIRVPDLISYIMKRGGPSFQGIMTYSVQESLFLAKAGFDDFLIAYPRTSEKDLRDFQEILHLGKKASLMIDHAQHISNLETYSKNHKCQKFPVVLDLDLALHSFAGWAHIGVYRSSISTLDDLKDRLKKIKNSSFCYPIGLMGYEAQVAGLADQNPFHPKLNGIKKLIKKKSIHQIIKKRQAAKQLYLDQGFDLEFFNGGGSGSLETSCTEDALTEVTVGSSFLQSHLFDYYQNKQNEAALFFVLEATRKAQEDIITCQGGGFIASGSVSWDKSPIPYLPSGLKLIKNEGCGEVQTPLQGAQNLKIGDPVVFRPAKAGELAERFSNYVLVRNGKVDRLIPTYRGKGEVFF